MVVQTYFLCYNILCSILWGIIISQIALAELYAGPSEYEELFYGMKSTVKVALLCSLLEIFHAATGMVKASPITTAMQVISRLHVVLVVWTYAPETSSYDTTKGKKAATLAMLVAWALSELIRYPYYVMQLSMKEPLKLWKWLRYSAFIILYPMGISAEVFTMIFALSGSFSHNKATQHFPVPMPNRLNFECSLFFLYCMIVALYVPGAVHMMVHMSTQRRKALKKKIL